MDRNTEETLFSRVFGTLKLSRERVLSGKINCIPNPFKRFSEEFAGVERGRYYNVTGQTKAGKSKFSYYFFIFKPLMYALENPDKMRMKAFIFSLEISQEDLYQEFICYLLYTLSRGKYRISPKDLRSTNSEHPVDEEILNILQTDEYQRYLMFFEENVKIIDSIRNPTGIFRFMKDYAAIKGKQHKKIINFVNNETKEITPKEVDDYYEPFDEDEYVFCMIDHISLIQSESTNGKSLSLQESMVKLSSDYLVSLRNKYKYIPVVIQQQSIQGQSIENVKMGKLKPSVADLGDSKVLARDCDVMLGIFSPFQQELQTYLGYEISKMRDNARFVEVIISRSGGAGSIAPLYFDGCTNYFRELPLPNDSIGIAKVYSMLDSIRQPKKVAMFLYKNNDELKEEEKSYRKSYRNFWNVWRGKNNKYHN